ncbi:MAG: hypothetical protein E4G99_00950 [Anaerolineales bacterium]|nr:MAG: hypothetical protein E4G99_00950 [Anaerolineales bacterium]
MPKFVWMASYFTRTARSSIDREGLMRRIVCTLILTLLLAACGSATPPATSSALPTKPPLPTHTPPPTATTFATVAVEANAATRKGEGLPFFVSELFSASGSCTLCHMNMTDDSGTDVSIDSDWRSTMMANAARDPYWQASVRREVSAFPELSETIQDKCSNCHMPMAQYSASVEGEAGILLGDQGFLAPDNELHTLAMDGVSCTLCHQIRSDGLGTEVSYSGGFYVDPSLRAPDRIIFGPYTIADQDARMMAGASGYRPEQGLHLSSSESCATCHILYTPYVDASGEIAGEFPEQVSYFEWYYSDYRSFKNCQDCHMPEADVGVRISTTSQTLRSPFGKHSFVGGNAYMLSMLDQFGDELGVTASSEQFQSAIGRTLDQLQNDTAILTVDEARLSGSRVILDLTLESLVGHKFPTGFPSRRAWLHVLVTDSNGQVVFESGGFNPDGSIVGNDNDADPTRFEQHYQAIVQPDQVQIYEAILRDSEGDLTTTLLRAAGYVKDNRLVPGGFEKGAPYADIAVRGGASEDIDFDNSFDSIQYVIEAGPAPGPFQVRVELLYQSIGFRWIENLGDQQGAEIDRFLGFAERLPNTPIVVAGADVEVGG